MRKTFLNRKEKKETSKAQIFYILVSIFDGMVLSFITIFLNQCVVDLGWSNVMSSFSLFLPPFIATISLIICSNFISEQKKNLKIMRILLIMSFISIILFSTLGLLIKNNSTSLLYIIFLLFTSIITGIHWSFSSFHTSCIADINYVEKTKYGHVCIFGPLATAIITPFAGFIAELFSLTYKGYLYLFLFSLPLLIIIFIFTFIFKSYPSNLIHDEDHEKVSNKELFKNKNYVLYLIGASLWIPLLWANTSLTSDLWTSYEGQSQINSFNPLSFGFYLSVSSLVEFIIIYINTHFKIGKKLSSSMSIALIMILIETLSLGILSYFYHGESDATLLLAIGIIFLHSFKGMANGLYLTSNVTMLNYILGPKKRRKAVFFAPIVYQFINSILQLCYPYFNSRLFIAFFALSLFALIGLSISFILGYKLHKNESNLISKNSQ